MEERWERRISAGDESANVAKAHDEEGARLEQQIDVEVVVPHEDVVDRAVEKEQPHEKLQDMEPAPITVR